MKKIMEKWMEISTDQSVGIFTGHLLIITITFMRTDMISAINFLMGLYTLYVVGFCVIMDFKGSCNDTND